MRRRCVRCVNGIRFNCIRSGWYGSDDSDGVCGGGFVSFSQSITSSYRNIHLCNDYATLVELYTLIVQSTRNSCYFCFAV